MTTLKLLHVLVVFIWIGSLLMLTRFLGYAVKEKAGIQMAIVKILRRVYLFIDLPAMIFTVGLGIWLLIWKEVSFKHGWIHMKLTFTFFLIVCDLWTAKYLFKETLPAGRWRYMVLHGSVGIFLILILVSIYVLKPIALATS